jgi:membrane-bound serine protease (ClpP class)
MLARLAGLTLLLSLLLEVAMAAGVGVAAPPAGRSRDIPIGGSTSDAEADPVAADPGRDLDAEARRIAASAAAAAAGPTVIPAWRTAERVVVLPIRGVVDMVSLTSLERRMARAREMGADAIVIELDTPGGRVDAALDITDLLKDRGETPANTVAWVRPRALSAGTIIALACREIVVASNCLMGDAAPIQVGLGMLQQMAPAERAKVEGPILAEVKDSARRNAWDENLVQAFVSVGMRLWMIEHVRTGELAFVTAEEYERIFGETPPTEIASTTPRAGVGAGSGGGVRPRFSPDLAPQPGAGPEPSVESIREELEYQQSLPRTRDPLGPADRSDWRLVRQVIDDDQLLTIKEPEARAYGLAAAVIDTDEQLTAFFGARELVRIEANWSEGLVRFLMSMPVRIVLIIGFILGFLLEAAAPGTTVFGLISAGCLVLLLGAPALAGAAEWWDIVLVVLGVLFIAAELFLIPGTGIAGFLGAGMLLVGLVGTFISGDLGTRAGQAELVRGLLAVLVGMFGAGVGAWLLSRQLHESPLLRRLVLESEIGGDPTRRSSTVLSAAGPITMEDSVGGIAIGDAGVAATDLRPAGRAEIGGRMMDVQSPGRYIEAGTPVRVVRIAGAFVEVDTETGP